MPRTITLALTLLALAASGANAQQITWSTIDGGGTMQSTGGRYALSGTIGQPDASSPAAAMTGGTYALVGGFWAGATAAPPCRCEWNHDATVNVFDLLSYLDEWFALSSTADLDADGQVNVFDLLGFLDCWFAASAGQPC